MNDPKQQYRALGTKVLLKVIPLAQDSSVILPEGKNHPNKLQTFEVISVGERVNDETYKLTVGEIVVVSAHQSQMMGVSREEQLLVVDRENIVLAISGTTLN